MAKRKRLTGPLEDYFASNDTYTDGNASPAPIARVAGDASVNAALDEVSRELTNARGEGRLVVRLPIDAIDEAWLMRDRTHPGSVDDPDFSALVESLRRNGQRTPIEVVDMGNNRYGLISGWRRLTALRRLYNETGDIQFESTLAFLRQPKSSKDAYVAMVEENEIRLALSYYERARIAAKSVEAGVFPTQKSALQTLFASASRAKRSKIGSFLRLYKVLKDDICFPQAITERLGLSLSKVIETDPAAVERLVRSLQSVRPESSEAEQRLLNGFVTEVLDNRSDVKKVSGKSFEQSFAAERSTGSSARQDNNEICPGIFLTYFSGKLQISGPAVDPAFRQRLEGWLRKDGER